MHSDVPLYLNFKPLSDNSQNKQMTHWHLLQSIGSTSKPWPLRRTMRYKFKKGNVTRDLIPWELLCVCVCVCASRATQIKTYSWDNAQVVLAGNKCDMDEERVVSVDSGRLLAEQLGRLSHTHSHIYSLIYSRCDRVSGVCLLAKTVICILPVMAAPWNDFNLKITILNGYFGFIR